MIELLRNIVRIPSLSFQEEEVRNFLSKTLDNYGIPHKIVKNNIIAINRHFDPKKKTLALDAHIDTVPASSQYSRNPFEPGNNDEIIYGLGSNDDGGSVVTMIHTFRHFFNKELPINLMLCLTAEEERSGDGGARYIYNALSMGLPRSARNDESDARNDGAVITSLRSDLGINGISYIIFGEPTEMRAAISERGLLVLDGEAHGVSGHAARGEGINALYIALEDIEKLRSYKFKKTSPSMGEVRLNVTQINAGTTHNVIPNSCKFVVDIRPTDCYTNEEILNELQAICKSELKARNLKNHSSATPANSLLLKTAQKLGIETYSSPTTSNWVATNKIEAIKMGPGRSERSHKADEFILRSELEEGLKRYIEFIENFCDGYTLE